MASDFWVASSVLFDGQSMAQAVVTQAERISRRGASVPAYKCPPEIVSKITVVNARKYLGIRSIAKKDFCIVKMVGMALVWSSRPVCLRARSPNRLGACVARISVNAGSHILGWILICEEGV